MPADDELIIALGRAVYNFAQLELSVGHLRRKLCAAAGGTLEEIAPGSIGGEIEIIAAELPCRRELLRRVAPLMSRFRELKQMRDGLLCLSSDNTVPVRIWRAAEILSLAHQFEVAAIEANQLLRRYF